MRAVTYSAYGSLDRLEVREVPPPEAREGELRVRVTRAALNPKDAFVRKGRFRLVSGRRFPKRTGLDFAGVVEESRTPRFRPGDRVFGALEELTALRGTVAEVVTCRDREAARIPDGVSDDAAAAVPLVGLTALQALRDLGHVREGTRVLVHGASGGVGTVAIQIGRLLGAEVETTSSPRNFDLCRRLGAARTWDYATSALDDARSTFDVVFDVYGNLRPARWRPWLGGRGVFITTIPTPRSLALGLLTRRRALQQRLVLVRARAADLEQLGAWLREGKLEAVLEARFPLDQVKDAFRLLESKRARGKILVDVA